MPNIRRLPNKPLVEAIFELRWKIPEETGDPNYSLFIGKLYESVKSEYPFYEPLPSSIFTIIPFGRIIQHRFRIDKDKWPLIQLGHGIVTINDSINYIWSDFGERVKNFVPKVFEAYPAPEQLKVETIELKYLDSFELDENENDLLKYLDEKLKCKISLPNSLFKNLPIIENPKSIKNTMSFNVKNPSGTIKLILGTARRKSTGKRTLLMEIGISSTKEEIPPIPDKFEQWIEAAHKITDEWFFTLIEGELERKFAND